MNTPLPPADDLTADWPADADNESLAQFAARFQAGLPQLPAASQQKIHQAIVGEMAQISAAAAARRRIPWPVRLAVAAGILLALSVGGYFVLGPRRPEIPSMARRPDPAPVTDRYSVKFVAPAVPAPEKALLQLEDNQSLFAD